MHALEKINKQPARRVMKSRRGLKALKPSWCAAMRWTANHSLHLKLDVLACPVTGREKAPDGRGRNVGVNPLRSGSSPARETMSATCSNSPGVILAMSS